VTEGPSLLADRLALAIVEHGPLPCERLARTVKSRTCDVRDPLRRDPRFEHRGAGRGSRWRLGLEPPERPWDGLGRILSPERRSPVEARLDELDLRVAELERRFADTGATAA
jgi:hypothetical protein